MRGILVPAGSVDHGTERHVLPQIVLVRDVIGVLLQFRARCEKPGPVRIGLERIRVGDRRDVDSQTGIAVDVPGSTQIVLALEDRQVVQAQPLELNGRTHSAEARPHYNCVVLHCHRRIPLVNCTSEKLHIRN